MLEGVLRVYWGLHYSIRVREELDQRPIIRRKKSSNTDQEGPSDSGSGGSETSYYRHSVHQFNLLHRKKEFAKEFSAEFFQPKKAEEVLEKSLLTRTLSDSKLDKMPDLFSIMTENHDQKTLPINFLPRSTQASFFKLDRFETSLHLPDEDQVKIKADPKAVAIENPTPEHTLEKIKVPINSKQVPKTEEETGKNEHNKKSTGPRALRRRHGRKYDKKTSLQRKSSFNGHW